MPNYVVRWEVDIEDVASPVDAALAAFNMMQQPRNPNDTDAAVCYRVWPQDGDEYTPGYEHDIDLADLAVALVLVEDEWKLNVCDTCNGEGGGMYGSSYGSCEPCNGTGTLRATTTED